MEYYIINENNQQVGPLTMDQLKNFKIKPTTKVWKQGLSDWVNAETLQELNNLFITPPPIPPNVPPPIGIQQSFQNEQPPLQTSTIQRQENNQPISNHNLNTTTGIELKLRFIILQIPIILLLVPVVYIDGKRYRKYWGTHFFELAEGKHTLNIYVPYLFFIKISKRKKFEFNLNKGEVKKIRFLSPFIVFMNGHYRVLN